MELRARPIGGRSRLTPIASQSSSNQGCPVSPDIPPSCCPGYGFGAGGSGADVDGGAVSAGAGAGGGGGVSALPPRAAPPAGPGGAAVGAGRGCGGGVGGTSTSGTELIESR